jgi:hypothetical protein
MCYIIKITTLEVREYIGEPEWEEGYYVKVRRDTPLEKLMPILNELWTKFYENKAVLDCPYRNKSPQGLIGYFEDDKLHILYCDNFDDTNVKEIKGVIDVCSEATEWGLIEYPEDYNGLENYQGELTTIENYRFEEEEIEEDLEEDSDVEDSDVEENIVVEE